MPIVRVWLSLIGWFDRSSTFRREATFVDTRIVVKMFTVVVNSNLCQSMASCENHLKSWNHETSTTAIFSWQIGEVSWQCMQCCFCHATIRYWYHIFHTLLVLMFMVTTVISDIIWQPQFSIYLAQALAWATNRSARKQTNKQTDRQTDWYTDRQTCIHSYIQYTFWYIQIESIAQLSISNRQILTDK